MAVYSPALLCVINTCNANDTVINIVNNKAFLMNYKPRENRHSFVKWGRAGNPGADTVRETEIC